MLVTTRTVLTVLCAVALMNWRCAAQRYSANLMDYGNKKRKCQDITLPLCKDIGYNKTAFPNKFLHDTEAEAGLEANQFIPLVEVRVIESLKNSST